MLNAVTIPDAQPMPKVVDVLNQFHGDSHLSTIDLKDAFWSVLLAVADRHKTAFATHDMLLQWMACPQGSRNGATVFARIIQQIFMGALRTISVYQDDIFLYAKNIQGLLAA